MLFLPWYITIISDRLLKIDSIQPTFSILISTKNRIIDLAFTLDKINYLIQKNEVECVVFDDGSTAFFNNNQQASHN